MTQLAEPNFPSIFTEGGNALRPIDRDMAKTLDAFSRNLIAILDKGISVDDNMDMSRVEVTTHATPGTEFSVAHGLGKVPAGYIVYGQEAAGNVFDGATANDETTLYLKSDASSKTFRLIVF